MEIRVDDLTGDGIRELLQEHLQNMFLITPPESVHALDIEGLSKPEITFWSVWENGELMG
jgi:putative acetyltransferase